ncbi:sugar ABC transporter substrate-binding protein [Curtobacterium citreum]|uniref:Sugar ABC transporter substrate-binding protein n=1 Tax=Curtobacterium citreum TaxID=2036 RepID=A0ABT2HEI3_9MICO|nr:MULTISPECIES: sugar ABC transporter substrate-binding protein [Curtobacterium]MCS6521684.1 sugar ABC transporter substrate-binding protein [Curtobacterium citreum]RDI02149.1 carbohydrate ABC transporter substrate-binding protein (CUT1 family) [Curtobacterium sp. AG1037]TQJ27073.1 carbohydrate ABC transporter substrate-binding protein (CUT1 family) [Curtobacterium citreum]GGL74183.1 sugar ABC transporter substrate-binding protein [Curtobacterium citreum]
MKHRFHSSSRRIRALVGAVAVVATVPLVLSGCSGSGSASSGGGSKTLTIEDYYAANYDTIYQQCAKTVGAQVKINHVAGAGLISKVLQQASSRTLPDVLMLDNPDVQQIAASGALSDLGDYGLDANDDVPGVKGANTYEGKLYGLQPVTNSIALYYNKKLLSDAGVQPPKTWDELKAAAKKLTSGSTYGFAMSNINTYEGTWQFLPFFWSNGGDEKDIATPEAAQALQLVEDLQNDGSMSKSSINWAQADVNNQFIAGKAAMMINGPWQLPALKEAKNLEFDSVPIPTRTGSATVAPLGGEAFTVPQTGDKEKMQLAGKFVGCLNSDKMQNVIAGVTGNVPTNTEVGAAWAKDHQDVASFVTTVQTARARTGELGPDWPKAATKIYTAVQLALTGKADPEQALEQAQSQNQ